MKEYIFTFGSGHKLANCFVRVQGEDFESARQKMFDTYGAHWAFQYESEEDAGVKKYGLKEVPFGTPNHEEIQIPEIRSLTFAALRGANAARLPQFRNKLGKLAHTREDGSDWTPAQWLQAVLGELGEYANFRKKFERGDITKEEFAIEAAKELADVQTYLDILARRCLDEILPHGALGFMVVSDPNGVDLGKATIAKFNEISERCGSSVRLTHENWYYADQNTNDKLAAVVLEDDEPIYP